MILMLLLLCLLGMIALCAALVWLNHVNQTRWMRIFCAERHLPPATMDAERDTIVSATQVKQDTRRRVSVPLPGPWSKPNASKNA